MRKQRFRFIAVLSVVACEEDALYLFPEVDGNIGDSQRHQEADERPVRTEGWELHHSTSRRDDRARSICLGLDCFGGKKRRRINRSNCCKAVKESGWC